MRGKAAHVAVGRRPLCPRLVAAGAERPHTQHSKRSRGPAMLVDARRPECLPRRRCLRRCVLGRRWHCGALVDHWLHPAARGGCCGPCRRTAALRLPPAAARRLRWDARRHGLCAGRWCPGLLGKTLRRAYAMGGAKVWLIVCPRRPCAVWLFIRRRRDLVRRHVAPRRLPRHHSGIPVFLGVQRPHHGGCEGPPRRLARASVLGHGRLRVQRHSAWQRRTWRRLRPLPRRRLRPVRGGVARARRRRRPHGLAHRARRGAQ
mmetsp:Transcript_23742/g.68669  ORF Transcript_23742/g.68669 Transcript_23742/m.68669 type:complete len:261 (-) Transcript_23742:484-1266(-)